eukprot:m.104750 g.104750  ORF g.104750 m.104750 type:complete len:118 (+) comp12644_c0_seq1:473-826(+)
MGTVASFVDIIPNQGTCLYDPSSNTRILWTISGDCVAGNTVMGMRFNPLDSTCSGTMIDTFTVTVGECSRNDDFNYFVGCTCNDMIAFPPSSATTALPSVAVMAFISFIASAVSLLQ